MNAEGGDNLLQRLWSGAKCVFGVVWSLAEEEDGGCERSKALIVSGE